MSIEEYFVQWRPNEDVRQNGLPIRARHMILFMDVLSFLLSWMRMGIISIALIWFVRYMRKFIQSLSVNSREGCVIARIGFCANQSMN